MSFDLQHGLGEQPVVHQLLKLHIGVGVDDFEPIDLNVVEAGEKDLSKRGLGGMAVARPQPVDRDAPGSCPYFRRFPCIAPEAAAFEFFATAARAGIVAADFTWSHEKSPPRIVFVISGSYDTGVLGVTVDNLPMIVNPSVPPVVVLGAGVSGLSCSIELLLRGYQVEIWARDPPLATTSAVAGAVWFPFHAAPADRVGAWAKETYDRLAELALSPSSGVTMREGVLCDPELSNGSTWRPAVGPVRATVPGDLPPGKKGEVFAAPIAEMPIYLEYLRRRFVSLGGLLRLRALASVAEAFAETYRVVNCTGLGARELFGDPEVFPVRGQLVRVAGVDLSRWYLDEKGPDGVSYIIPRSHDVVLGGTVEPGNEDLTPDPAETKAILARCARLAPDLSGGHVVAASVGLRPGRSAIRLEVEEVDARHAVIHNYGHGGAGLTLSWGCAREVADLADRRWGVGQSASGA